MADDKQPAMDHDATEAKVCWQRTVFDGRNMARSIVQDDVSKNQITPWTFLSLLFPIHGITCLTTGDTVGSIIRNRNKSSRNEKIAVRFSQVCDWSSRTR